MFDELVEIDLREFKSNEVFGFQYKRKETVVVVGKGGGSGER